MGKYFFIFFKNARVLINTDGKHLKKQLRDLTKLKKYVIIKKNDKIFRAYVFLILTKLKKFGKIILENNKGEICPCTILIILKKCSVAA
jgi:hypothetical protein